MASSFLGRRNIFLGLGIALALFVFIGGTTVITVLKISQNVNSKTLTSCLSDFLVPIAKTNGSFQETSKDAAMDGGEDSDKGGGDSGRGKEEDATNSTLVDVEKIVQSVSGEWKREDDGSSNLDGLNVDKELDESEEEQQERFPFKVRKMQLDPARREDLLPTVVSDWSGDRVFVISSEEGPAGGPALAHMDAILERLQLKYTRAFAPEDLSDEKLRKYAPIVPDGVPRTSDAVELGGAELRYTLAHYELWWHIVSNEIPFAIVLEDDAPLSEDGLRGRMEAGLRELNIMLAGDTEAFDVCAMLRKAHLDYGEYLVTTIVKHAYASSGAGAYVVTLAGARKLLARVRIDDPVDVGLWKALDITRVAFHPTLGGNPQECSGYSCGRPFIHDPMAKVGSSLKASVKKMKLGKSEKERAQMIKFATASGADEASAAVEPGGRSSGPGKHRRKKRKFSASLSGWNTYVISMERDAPRFEKLSGTLEKLGFGNVTYGLALDASNAEISTFTHLITPDHRSRTRSAWGMERGFLSRGEIGCGLSHYLVWLDVIRRRLPYAIVFEDDVDLLEGFQGSFERNVAQLEKIAEHKADLGFDVCFLGRQTILKSVYNPVLADNIVSTAMSWCTYAYIISYEGAVRMTERFYLDDPIDSVWWRIPGVRFWGFEPSLVGALSGSGGIYDSRTELGSRQDPFPAGRGQ